LPYTEAESKDGYTQHRGRFNMAYERAILGVFKRSLVKRDINKINNAL
jgi:hypothetical protein